MSLLVSSFELILPIKDTIKLKNEKYVVIKYFMNGLAVTRQSQREN